MFKKKPVKVQTFNKDIVCLPKSVSNHSSSSMGISYPRGQLRAKLGSSGLIGKLHLSSVMTEEDIKKEIRSVF